MQKVYLVAGLLVLTHTHLKAPSKTTTVRRQASRQAKQQLALAAATTPMTVVATPNAATLQARALATAIAQRTTLATAAAQQPVQRVPTPAVAPAVATPTALAATAATTAATTTHVASSSTETTTGTDLTSPPSTPTAPTGQLLHRAASSTATAQAPLTGPSVSAQAHAGLLSSFYSSVVDWGSALVKSERDTVERAIDDGSFLDKYARPKERRTALSNAIEHTTKRYAEEVTVRRPNELIKFFNYGIEQGISIEEDVLNQADTIIKSHEDALARVKASLIKARSIGRTSQPAAATAQHTQEQTLATLLAAALATYQPPQATGTSATAASSTSQTPHQLLTNLMALLADQQAAATTQHGTPPPPPAMPASAAAAAAQTAAR